MQKMHIIFFSYFKVNKLFKSSLEIIRVHKDKLNIHSFRSGTATAKKWYTEIWKKQDDIKSKLSLSANLGNYINKKKALLFWIQNSYLINTWF